MSGKLLRLIKDFLSKRKQRVVLNGQGSPWMDDQTGAPEGFTLGPILFLIYFNDLPDKLVSNSKLLTDDTSFSTVIDPNVTKCYEIRSIMIYITLLHRPTNGK